MKAKPKAKDNFKEAILAQPVDVEELGKQGRRKGVCPYYTARSAVPDAQLVLLPYSALLAQVSHTPLPPVGPRQHPWLPCYPCFGAVCILAPRHAIAWQEQPWVLAILAH